MAALKPSSPNSLLSNSFLFSLLHLLLLSTATSSPTLGIVSADKSRLGSTPPSCHNKCNECSPCTAVQVPTGPSLPLPAAVDRNRELPLGFLSPSSQAAAAAGSGGYTNYKPLGWKCRCGDRFYNP